MSADRLTELEARIAALEERNTRAEAEVLRLKYYAARRAYALRDVTMPGVDKAEGGQPKTWSQWWSEKFGDGETLEQFVKRAGEMNLKATVLEYELSRFGKSALDGSAKAPE